MKLNLGCGGNILPGWQNHDADVDITKPLPFPNDSAEIIFAEHVCEHVTGPQFLWFLDECRRVLKVGGDVRICMPVLNRLTLDARRDIIVNHGHLAAYTPELICMYLETTGFNNVREVAFSQTIDGHWRVIGKEKDALETSRWEGTK